MYTWQEFADLFAEHGNVTAVAKATNSSRQSIYTWMKQVSYVPPQAVKRKVRKSKTLNKRIVEALDEPMVQMESVHTCPTIQIEFQALYNYVHERAMEHKKKYNRISPTVNNWFKAVLPPKQRHKRLIMDTINFINDMLRNPHLIKPISYGLPKDPRYITMDEIEQWGRPVDPLAMELHAQKLERYNENLDADYEVAMQGDIPVRATYQVRDVRDSTNGE